MRNKNPLEYLSVYPRDQRGWHGAEQLVKPVLLVLLPQPSLLPLHLLQQRPAGLLLLPLLLLPGAELAVRLLLVRAERPRVRQPPGWLRLLPSPLQGRDVVLPAGPRGRPGAGRGQLLLHLRRDGGGGAV